MAEGRPITFLSDYGQRDEFAGVCRAVIAQIAPDATLTDLTHGVPRGDVTAGALSLAAALPHCAPGVHLAVVDPGVGTARRAVAVAAGDEGRILVGPDNGLLGPSLERLGGASRAVELSRSPFRLEPVSATFHGRDLFAPVTAHLSLGATLDEAGEAIDPESLMKLDLPVAQVDGDAVIAHALRLDGYGNVALDVSDKQLPAAIAGAPAVRVTTGAGAARAKRAGTFADAAPGDLLLHLDSSGALALAVNGGSAAGLLNLAAGDEVRLEPA